jgi:hypothetical protein
VQLRQGGAVTVVLSRRRRNDSPKHTKLPVTNLPQATAHTTVAGYLRRWPVELCIKELKGVVGLGQPQVTKDMARVERSVAVALIAYLPLLRLQATQIKPGTSWSAFTLKQQVAWEVGTRQLKRVAQQEVRKEFKLQLIAKEAPLLMECVLSLAKVHSSLCNVRASFSSTVGPWVSFHTPGSPPTYRINIVNNLYTSSRSVLVTRARRSTAILEASTTRFCMPSHDGLSPPLSPGWPEAPGSHWLA